MTTYQSIPQTNTDEGTPIADAPPPRARWRRILSILLGIGALYWGVSWIRERRASRERRDNGSLCFSDRQCKSEICCYGGSLTSLIGKCQECCVDSFSFIHFGGIQQAPGFQTKECALKMGQPPAGEFGRPFCSRKDFVCETYQNGESSQIPSTEEGGYPLWLPSDTMDNWREFYKVDMPRTVFSDTPKAVMEQVWYIDFNEQEDSFDKDGVNFNGTHLFIPNWEHLHAGYSRSYHSYDEHETGILTLVGGENVMSVVSALPQVIFVEKYHTLTYNGKLDTSRGDWIREKSAEQIKKRWVWHRWYQRALTQALSLFRRDTPFAQVEAGVDNAVTWQVRRYVEEYPEEDYGSVNPTSSSSWASHSEKAKEAIDLAKDVTFEREISKSEVHCKHLEEQIGGIGVDYTDTHFVLPVGRPITMLSGEMAKSPVYYLGFVVGHVTAHYDQDANILQLYYQGYSQSRQYTDVKFPGPYPSGLYVSPVAEGSNYVVDPDVDGRSDMYVRLTAPPPRLVWPWTPNEAEFTIWQRPRAQTCSWNAENGDFWDEINYFKIDEGFYTWVLQHKHVLGGLVRAMPCATYFMRTDYGIDTHGLGVNEFALWGHMLMEGGKHRREISLGTFWDHWECFYHKKDLSSCH